MSIESNVELSGWGPERLRELFKEVETRLNKLRPIQGTGIRISEGSDGVQISIDNTPAVGSNILDGVGGGGGGGSDIDLYGACNGAPAVFHLKQSSAPTPVV